MAQTIPFAFWKVASGSSGSSGSCSGQSVGGYCWYLGANGESCDTVCTNNSGTCNLGGVRDYAGSQGTDGNCESVMTALGHPGVPSIMLFSVGAGCSLVFGVPERDQTPTTCSAAAGGAFGVTRACACTSSPGNDYSPDPIDWPDFSDISIDKSLTGINQAIILQFSASYLNGSPSIQYRKNSGSWIGFSPGSPQSASFNENDTIEFQMTGTISHSATITVTNLSDSNALIDTVVGTIVCPTRAAGGFCWYLGANGESCDTVCSNNSLACNLIGTRDYAGSGGTDVYCEKVMTVLGFPGTPDIGLFHSGNGCIRLSGENERDQSATLCGAAVANYSRACACE